MKPVELSTARLVLDQPTAADVGLIAEYCQDPLFERFLTIPWPYEWANAAAFVGDVVPGGWASGSEATWAMRHDGELLGVVGFRFPGKDVGFWIGAPHRGQGYMSEALGAVADWVFEQDVDVINWECFPGNAASASAARKAGFAFTGEAPSRIPDRNGAHPAGWHATLHRDDSRTPKPGWPAALPPAVAPTPVPAENEGESSA